jgi:hypothetical protein
MTRRCRCRTRIYRTLFNPVPGRATQGADRSPAHWARDPTAGGHPPARWSRQPAGHPAHLRTPCRSRRPSGARALGRRPGLRQTDEPDRDPGGAVDPVRDPGPAARRPPQGRRRGRRTGRRDPTPAQPNGPIPDLGPGQRDGRARTLHRSHRRSTSATPSPPGSVAAWKTPTGSCANTYPAPSTSAPSPKPILTPSPTDSTDALDRPSASRHPHRPWPKWCDDRLSPHR